MSKKIILRQSVKSGVAVVFFFGLGMASINAQTTQPTGKVGINTTNPTETLDVKGKVRVRELYTDNQQTGTNNNATFTATNVVTVDNNGVLGKKLLSDITAAQTPNLPWKKVGTTENAVPAGGLSMYSRYAVGIGEYGASGSKIGSSFEINEGGTTQLGLINTKNNIVTKWHISTEDRALTFTKRKPEEGRIFSLTQDAKLFLGNNLLSEGGSNAKVILDGGNGKIGINQNSAGYNLDVAGDAKISGLKTTDDNITDGSTTSKYSPAKMVVVDKNGVLGKQDFPTIPTMPTIPTEPWQVAGGTTQANANSQDIYQSGKVGIGNFGTGKSLSNQLEVAGNTSITGTLELNSSSNKYKMGLSGKSLMFSNTAGHYTAALTNEAVLYLGKPTSNNNTTTTIDANGQNAKIIINGADGRIGINTNENAKYNLNVNGDAKISGLKDGNGYTATHMVVADTNGVLGKANIPSIPTEPWQVAGGITQATANNQKIYQNNNVGIGDYSSTDIGSRFEINGGNSSQLGLINGSTKWDISTEDKALTFTKRKPENGRIFSVTQEAKLYLGHNLLSESGNNAKVILDGGNGKIGINKNSASYNLDVDGDAKISGLKSGTGYTAAHMVVADANGVLGKANIPVIPTIPTEPWRQLGGTNEATTNSQNIYQNGKVGIGNYTSTSSFDSDFEVNSNRNGYHVGIANGEDTKWNLSAESGSEKAFTITKRHNDGAGRLLSLDKDAKLYLGNTLLNTSGSGAKILVDGGQGKIGIGKNSAEYNLDVAGNAKISGLPDKGSSDTVKMVVVDNSGVLKKADIPSGNGNGVTKHTTTTPACNATNAGTIHYKEGVTVNGTQTSVMGFCMKTADNKYRWFYIFGGAGTTTGSAETTPTFGAGL